MELIKKNDSIVEIQKYDQINSKWVSEPELNLYISKLSLPQRNKWLFPSKHPSIYRGIKLYGGMRVIVHNANKYWKNFSSGLGVFRFCSLNSFQSLVRLGWVDDSFEFKKTELSKSIDVDKKLIEVNFPKNNNVYEHLMIETSSSRGVKIFLAIHKQLERTNLLSKCLGNGVEIGPGPKPQVHSNKKVSVKYVEQSTPDQWEKLYTKNTNVSIDKNLWDQYVVGNAENIPVKEDSLDFIFSSHVFEHLANPLGHLKYWSSLLKPKGYVLAVIPDCKSCKDYIFEPSTLKELENEFLAGLMSPSLEHYKRWADKRMPGLDPKKIMLSGRSIHVHFYSPESIKIILSKFYRELGFKKFSVISEYNHKDFHICLQK